VNRPRSVDALVRLALALACFVLSALAFKRAVVRLVSAVVAWFASALAFSLGALLLAAAAWAALRARLRRRNA
jgi:hypothetical protein